MFDQKEYMKSYNEKNRSKLREYATKKVVCRICGSMLSKSNLSNHQKSKKCQSFVLNDEKDTTKTFQKYERNFSLMV